MTKIYNIDPSELIEKTAEELKKIESIKPTPWAAFVRTGVSRERPPIKGDWWYVRAASILRKIYRFGPIGVSKLRTKYGGKKNRGVRPEKFYKASGNIIRKIMQQLTKAELIKDAQKGGHKGKIITPKGISLLNKAADTGAVKREKPVKEEKKKEKKAAKEEKTTEKKVEETIKKTKEFAEKKEPTTEKIVKELKKKNSKEKSALAEKKNG